MIGDNTEAINTDMLETACEIRRVFPELLVRDAVEARCEDLALAAKLRSATPELSKDGYS